MTNPTDKGNRLSIAGPTSFPPMRSTPFYVNILQNPFIPPEIDEAVVEPPTKYTSPPPANPLSAPTDTFSNLLPAAYRTLDNHLRVPEAQIDYLLQEFDIGRLDRIHGWLWYAGLPVPPKPLHRQRILGREVTVTEQIDLHLVQSAGYMYVKPIPRIILDPSFWDSVLSCHEKCACQPTTPKADAAAAGYGESKTSCDRRKVRSCVLGLLFSYAALISYESDFYIARQKHLLPEEVSWPAWKEFVRELLGNKDIHRDMDRRFLYGELRLSRLNKIYMLTNVSLLRGYMTTHSRYSSFLTANFEVLASIVIYVVLVLTAMQVGLATRNLGGSNSFQSASYRFTVFAIVGPLGGLFAIIAMFLVHFTFNLMFTIRLNKKRFRYFRSEKDGTKNT